MNVTQHCRQLIFSREKRNQNQFCRFQIQRWIVCHTHHQSGDMLACMTAWRHDGRGSGFQRRQVRLVVARLQIYVTTIKKFVFLLWLNCFTWIGPPLPAALSLKTLSLPIPLSLPLPLSPAAPPKYIHLCYRITSCLMLSQLSLERSADVLTE